MRIGFDVDGVFADFNKSFIDLMTLTAGRDLFPARPFDIPCWSYPTMYGYTHEEESRAWDHITSNPTWWLHLSPYDEAMNALKDIRELADQHDVYFITSRPGIRAKHQTEVWLATHSGDFLWTPTVLISSRKGNAARTLDLDVYIDDRYRNCVDVVTQHGSAATYLLDRPWNRPGSDEYQAQNAFAAHIERVYAVDDMLQAVLTPGVKTA